MALELVAHFESDVPESLLRLLSMMLGLPQTFLDDPTSMFAGDMAQGKHTDPRARESAMIIDAYHLKSYRAPLALNALAKKLQDNLKLEKPIARATLRKWRAESDYASYVAFVGTL